MDIMKNINQDCLKIGTDANSIEGILKEIANLAKKNNILNRYSAEEIYDALLKREKLCSTGFENHIAIPHCAFDDLEDFVIGVITAPKGIDFKAIDSKKTKIFFFIIGPSKERNKHIQILSSISRLVKNKDIINKIINANNTETLNYLITKNTEIKEETLTNNEKALFHVFIQKEQYFEDILQIFSEVVDGSISVIETMNAGHFLHTLPLFSTFWSEDTKTYSKIIIAVVNKKLANNIIRKINTNIENIDKQPGILITVNDLFYTAGSIDF